MAKLKVFLDGQMVSEYELLADRDFIAGRGESCDCVLRPERGISRQHFKINLRDTGWELESLSRYGELYIGANKIEKHLLRHGEMFAAPPYEFVFEESSERITPDVPLPSMTNSKVRMDDDRTVIGSSSGAAMLRLIDFSGQTRQTFSLQGLSWVAGRDIGCSLFIDNAKISRRQFEIQKVDETFFIRDLESVNGTILNGVQIPSNDWTQLNSSDIITIADWSLVFEIRDASFEQRMRDIDPAFQAPVAYADTSSTPNPMIDDGHTGSMPALYLPPRPFTPGGHKKKGLRVLGLELNPVRIMILVIALGGAAYYMTDGTIPETHLLTKAQTPFDKLSPEKQQLVKQAYQLARDLYTTGKYELANQKIDEIHGLIPYYEDSKELQKYIDNAIQVQRDRERLAAQQEDERKRKEKVVKVLNDCRALVSQKQETITMEEVEHCLAPAMEFEPDNSDFAALRSQVDQILTDRKLNAAKAEEFQKLVARRDKMYIKARTLDKSGRSLAALDAYHGFVKSTLPDPNNLIPKAKRHIASLEKTIGTRQNELKAEAEEAYKKNDRKQAVILLRKALRINPRNTDVEERIGEILVELRKDMQMKYQESILEESVGQVPEAKKKWLEIQKASVPGEDYFEKSKIKLKKYGELTDAN